MKCFGLSRHPDQGRSFHVARKMEFGNFRAYTGCDFLVNTRQMKLGLKMSPESLALRRAVSPYRTQNGERT